MKSGLPGTPEERRRQLRAAMERNAETLRRLEGVEGRDTSVEAILARQDEQRIDSDECERQLGSLPTDDEG